MIDADRSDLHSERRDRSIVDADGRTGDWSGF
jgi:hypothetical protein